MRVLSGAAVGPVEIDSLICPLRYDLLIRMELCRFWLSDQGLDPLDAGRWLEEPAVRNYFIWHREVESQRFRRHRVADDERLRQEFPARVNRAVTLWRSLESRGLDPADPIRLRTGKNLRTANGKVLAAEYFAGDGCHRLAWLYAKGARILEPHQFEVQRFTDFTPPDNTHTLIHALPLSREEYCRFLSRYYCAGEELSTPERILLYLSRRDRGRLEEVLSVLEGDLPGTREEWEARSG